MKSMNILLFAFALSINALADDRPLLSVQQLRQAKVSFRFPFDVIMSKTSERPDVFSAKLYLTDLTDRHPEGSPIEDYDLKSDSTSAIISMNDTDACYLEKKIRTGDTKKSVVILSGENHEEDWGVQWVSQKAIQKITLPYPLKIFADPSASSGAIYRNEFELTHLKYGVKVQLICQNECYQGKHRLTGGDFNSCEKTLTYRNVLILKKLGIPVVP